MDFRRFVVVLMMSFGAADGTAQLNPRSIEKQIEGSDNILHGAFRVEAVTPDPRNPASEKLGVFWGSGDGPADKIVQRDQVLKPVSVVETRAGSSAVLLMPDNGRVRLAERSAVRIDRISDRGSFWLYLKTGAVRLLGGDANVQNAAAMATQPNTDFEMRVRPDGLIEVQVFEGTLLLTNSYGRLPMSSSNTYRALVRVGSRPLPALLATNTVQWWLNFPVVLDPADVQFSEPISDEVRNSFSQYARGGYAQALALYPGSRLPESDSEKSYAAALRLLAGDLPGAEVLLRQVTTPTEAVGALMALINTVRGQPSLESLSATTSSGWLSESYRRQARHDLSGARAAAYAAAKNSPGFIAAWVRVAELELGREDLGKARSALAHLKAIAPDHVPTLVLEGFLLLSEGRVSAAADAFTGALGRDSASADAWFGLGMVLIRRGQGAEGIEALKNAIALEPQRSLLRSYLAKALEDMGRTAEGEVQLQMAKTLDPKDPTPWLYAAWFDYAHNRVNPAITNLGRSMELNDHLQIFRSRAQLDQDRALRASSLARFYHRANMPEVALGQAARAVSANYSDIEAHLYLADAFNLLREPTRFDLRYETAWFNEVLLANLLSPVGSGIVSPTLVGQEYGQLFAQDGMRLTSFGEARSDGEFRQLATQSGHFGRTAYALDVDWSHKDGTRPNNDLDRTEVYFQLKQQAGIRDTALLLLEFQEYTSGDNFQYLDPAQARPDYRFDESHNPITLFLWRHEWTPDDQTLALAGRLANNQQFQVQTTNTVILRDAAEQVIGRRDLLLDLDYESQLEAWLCEVSHIARREDHSLIFGSRFVDGDIQSRDVLSGSTNSSRAFGDSTLSGVYHQAEVTESIQRVSIYGYDTWQVVEALCLTAGVAWDQLKKPSNFRHPPLAAGDDLQSCVVPKAGLVWDVARDVILRGTYAQSLGGVTLDESYRLEPVQIAGFSQSFRTVIPESTGVGSVSGHRLHLGGAALDVRLPTQTYVTLDASLRRAEVDQDFGVFELDNSRQRTPPGYTGQSSEQITFQETGFSASVNQLLGPYCVLGAAYGYRLSDLERDYPALTLGKAESADLYWARAQVTMNASRGLFARASASWYWQQYETGASTWENHTQIDLELGWRFPREKGALSVGIMNLSDDDYRLAPISGLGELPRERVFFVRLWLNL
jgi:outer membrane receptor protein involved in Fe transport/Tfp pilus assembly protein PilF